MNDYLESKHLRLERRLRRGARLLGVVLLLLSFSLLARATADTGADGPGDAEETRRACADDRLPARPDQHRSPAADPGSEAPGAGPASRFL